jgi:hypothetical protein
MINDDIIKHYKKYKYCVIKNFMPEQESDDLIEAWDYREDAPFYADLPRTFKTGPYSELKRNSAHVTGKRFLSAFLKACRTRVEVLIKSDELLLPYSIEDFETNPSLTIDIMEHYGGWSRFMHYKNSKQNFGGHKDAVGDIMAILHLSTNGVNYDGGLHIVKPDDEVVCVDTKHNLSKGDLLLIDGNYYEHWVKIRDFGKEIGRLTFFINLNPHGQCGKVSREEQENKIF